MKKIKKIADKYNLFIVEDCALSLGAYIDDVHTGNFGDVGCFSFYPVKHITTGEGGMVVTNNDEISSRIGNDRAFGIDRQIQERKIPGIYDVQSLGLNYRMNEIQAAMGIEQMKKVEGFLHKRKNNFERLYQGLEEIEDIHLFSSSYDEFQSSYYCLELILNDSLGKKRFEIVKNLNNQGIGTSVYYPGPVPLMTYYRKKYGFNKDMFPKASKISNQGIALPVGPHIGFEEIDYIISGVKKVLKEAK
jgi:dTDP-4-amino-4,6-dideoxygalactose transaminase